MGGMPARQTIITQRSFSPAVQFFFTKLKTRREERITQDMAKMPRRKEKELTHGRLPNTTASNYKGSLAVALA